MKIFYRFFGYRRPPIKKTFGNVFWIPKIYRWLSGRIRPTIDLLRYKTTNWPPILPWIPSTGFLGPQDHWRRTVDFLNQEDLQYAFWAENLLNTIYRSPMSRRSSNTYGRLSEKRRPTIGLICKKKTYTCLLYFPENLPQIQKTKSPSSPFGPYVGPPYFPEYLSNVFLKGI